MRTQVIKEKVKLYFKYRTESYVKHEKKNVDKHTVTLNKV